MTLANLAKNGPSLLKRGHATEKLLLIALLLVLGAVILWAESAAAAQQDMIILDNGNTLVGQVVFGIPAVLSLEDTSGNTFTVNKDNVKVLRFGDPGKKQDVIETFDGNILTGQIGGIPDVLGVQSAGGDVLSVKKSSINEIRFGAAPQDQTSTPKQPVTPPVGIDPTTCGQRNSALHALASIIPGLGQLLNGESIIKAGIYLVSSLFIYPINAVIAAIDAYISAERMNRCEPALWSV